MTPPGDRTAPLRAGRFSFEEPTLFFRRLRLYEDRIEMSGWRWSGRYRRMIPLERVLQVDVADDRLVLWLTPGSTVRLRVDEPRAWKARIDGCLDDVS